MIGPPWLRTAFRELGVKEIAGPQHTGRILAYHAATTFRATTDEIAWCSSFINWLFLQAGMARTGSAAARSWLEWGAPLTVPRLGAVTVFKRGTNPAQGHVGLLLELDDAHCWVLGGNQSNAVTVQHYPRADVLGFRWPLEAP